MVRSRDVSSGEGPNLREKKEGGEAASSVLCDLMEARCSSEVSDSNEGLGAAEATSHELPAESAPLGQVAARLAALEHLLDAVAALLDAGESSRAKTLAHAWRASRQ